MNAAAKVIHQNSLFAGSLIDIRLSKEFVMILGLVVAIIMSAIAVVYSTNHNRSVLNQVEMAKRQNHQLHIRAGKLLLEQASLSTAYRIEKQAGGQLGMTFPAVKQFID